MTDSCLNSTQQLADSPLQKLHSPFLDEARIELYVKRDDLIHPQFGGNKWRKLKYNLIYAREDHFDTLLTFGGAWSNHIYATSAAGKHFGFKTIGLIRGEEHSPLNATLSFASDCGMELHYIDRKRYRQKNTTEFLDQIKQQFGNIYILPEGGSNTLAMRGCQEIVQEVSNQLDKPFDIICCASGTGATLAGLIHGIESEKNTMQQTKAQQNNARKNDTRQRAIGFSALKGGEFLSTEVSRFLADAGVNSTNNNWEIESRFHFGGYAKINNELIQFMHEFQSRYNITLDAVYTAKMFYGLFEQIKSGNFQSDTVIVVVHSGGLQGNKGFDLTQNIST